jgi:hypothetical protein
MSLATIQEIKLAAAKSMTESCEKFLGKDSKCKLPLERFEKGEITFDTFLEEFRDVVDVLETPALPIISDEK